MASNIIDLDEFKAELLEKKCSNLKEYVGLQDASLEILEIAVEYHRYFEQFKGVRDNLPIKDIKNKMIALTTRMQGTCENMMKEALKP